MDYLPERNNPRPASAGPGMFKKPTTSPLTVTFRGTPCQGGAGSPLKRRRKLKCLYS